MKDLDLLHVKAELNTTDAALERVRNELAFMAGANAQLERRLRLSRARIVELENQAAQHLFDHYGATSQLQQSYLLHGNGLGEGSLLGTPWSDGAADWLEILMR